MPYRPLHTGEGHSETCPQLGYMGYESNSCPYADEVMRKRYADNEPRSIAGISRNGSLAVRSAAILMVAEEAWTMSENRTCLGNAE